MSYYYYHRRVEMSSEHQLPMVVELNNNLQDVGEKTATVFTGTALPASILRGPCDTTVLRGAKVVLETSYQGDPEPCVQWLRAVSLNKIFRVIINRSYRDEIL